MSDKRYEYRLKAGKLYEYRRYEATPGNLEVMHQRHVTAILPAFRRHGVKLVGFWMPTFGAFDNELVFICEWDSLIERECVWKQYLQDPEWRGIWKETDKNGAVHARVYTELWRAAPYTPEPHSTLAAVRHEERASDKLSKCRLEQPKHYEYRRYEATPGNLEAMHQRFETNALPIWAHHGIKLVGFWIPTFGGFNNELIYINEWDSLAERERVWKRFLEDPEWQAILKETDKNGALTAGVHTELWRAAPYTPEPHARLAAVLRT
ncbi:NIPSNAP family protein [Bradyrhizobium sp. USDA 4504]